MRKLANWGFPLVRCPRARRRWRMVRAIGGGCMALAALIATLGQLASSNHHTWLLVAGTIGAFAVFCVVVGWIGVHVSSPVPSRHLETLHHSCDAIEHALHAGTTTQYGQDGHKPREAFRAHYRRLAKILDRRDSLIVASEAAKVALADHIESEMASHGIAWPEYALDVIEPWLTTAAEEGSLTAAPLVWYPFCSIGAPMWSGPPHGGFRSAPDGPDLIVLPPLPLESRKEWDARGAICTTRFDSFVAALYESVKPFATAAQAAAKQLADFRTERQPDIENALKLIRECDPPRTRTWRCPTC